MEAGRAFLYNYLAEQRFYYNPIGDEVEHAKTSKLMYGSSVVGLARLVHYQKKSGTILL